MSKVIKILNAIYWLTKWFKKVKPVLNEVIPVNSEKKNLTNLAGSPNLPDATTTLFQRKNFPGTPFTGILENGSYILTMGMYRMAEKSFNSFDEMEEYINSDMWNLILLISIIANKHKNDIKEN